MNKKRKLIQGYSLWFLVGLTILLLVIFQYSSIKAEKYPPVLRSVEENVPGLENATGETQKVGESTEKVNDIEQMINKWKEKNIRNEQWIHVVYLKTSDVDNGVILPSGEPMPLAYVGNDWYYVNKDGLVEKGVFSMEDAEGNIFQQSAFQNNIMINFTFADRQEGILPYPLSIDFGYMNQTKEAKNLGLEIRKLREEQQGKLNISYTYTEKLKTPTQMGNEKGLVDSITIKGYFDEVTGDFVKVKTIWIMNNGININFDTTEIVSIEYFPEAPNEILTILDGVK